MLGHIAAQAIQQVFKQLEGFVFVFVQWITLCISTEPNDAAQMFQSQKMFTPFCINGLQQHLAFDLRHGFGAKRRSFVRHHFIGGHFDPLTHDIVINALFGSPCNDGQIQIQLLDHRSIQTLRIPLIRIGFGRHIGVNQIINHLIAHVGDNFGQICGFHDFTTLTKNCLALIVHHVVEFQQLFPNVKVAAFDLGLGAFERFINPRVNDGFAFFHTQGRQDFIQTF